MKLRFKEQPFGFTLEAEGINKDKLKEVMFKDVAPYIDFYTTQSGEIGFVSWPFFEKPIRELEIEMKYLNQNDIPGRYDVPELGIKNATFVKVLEAIKKYYQTKKQVVAKQKRGTNAPAY